MKKTLLLFSTLLALSASDNNKTVSLSQLQESFTKTVLAEVENKEINPNIKRIENMPLFLKEQIKVSRILDDGKFFHVVAKSDKPNATVFQAFITKDFKTAVIGHKYNTATGEEIQIPLDQKILLNLKNLAAYTVGSGENEYFLFTDPECPYCMQLEKKMDSLAPNAKIYVILFPLNFHKNARAMSYFILSQKTNDDKALAMHNIANGDKAFDELRLTLSELRSFDKLINTGVSFAEKLGINGTPTLLDAQGNRTNPGLILK